jgi:GTP-binding protein
MLENHRSSTILPNKKNLARISAEAGRTKTINLYEIDKRWFLVDLPGYGYAKTSKDERQNLADMIHNYLTGTEQLALVFVVTDALIGPTLLDEEMIETLESQAIPYVIIANKFDKLPKSKATLILKNLVDDFPGATVIPHSIESPKHRGDILEQIEVAIRASSNS